MNQERRMFIKGLVAGSSLFCVSLFVACVIVEGGLRLTFYGRLFVPRSTVQIIVRPHRTRGVEHVPNGTMQSVGLASVARMRINSKGLRDREHELQKKEGVFRILVLGDSFMEGFAVNDDECMPAVLEELLGGRNVEVVNTGTGTYGCAQEYLMLEEEGSKYAPDLIVQGFFAENDPINDSHTLERLLYGPMEADIRPYASWDARTGSLRFSSPPYETVLKNYEGRQRFRDQQAQRAGWFRDVAAYKVAAWIWTSRNPVEYDPNVLLGAYLDDFVPALFPENRTTVETYARAWSDAWSITERLIEATRERAERMGARYVLMFVPSKFQGDPGYRQFVKNKYKGLRLDPDKPARMLKDTISRNAIPALDLTPAFRQAYSSGHAPLFHQFEDKHWSAAGHRLAAVKLFEFLEQQHFLPQR